MTDFAQRVAEESVRSAEKEFGNATYQDGSFGERIETIVADGQDWVETIASVIRRLLAEHASPDLDTLARELAAEIIGPAWTPEDASHIAVMMNEALAPYFAARDERAAASIDGVVVFMRSESEGGDRCICCDGPHIFNRRLVLDPWESRLPKHMQTSVNDWLYDAVLFDNANEGARVRVTVEILALLPKEASDED